VTTKPEISEDDFTWAYNGKWNDVDMVAIFVLPDGQKMSAVPEIKVYGPETWKQEDVEIEWGFKKGTEKANYSGSSDGYFGLIDKVKPIKGDVVTTINSQKNTWKSITGDGSRRGVDLSLLYVEHQKTSQFPYGHPRDTRITVWTTSGNFTFLVADLEKGPILAPEYGFFVTKKGSNKTARGFTAELKASKVKSIREMTLKHREATWEQAMREIRIPMMPPGETLPPYPRLEEPSMQVIVPDEEWMDAWRKGVSQFKKGELSFMFLSLEAPRPIHSMDLVGLKDEAAKWLEGFLQRPGDLADGDFSDGSGSFSQGKLFHETALGDFPGYPSYELIHNGGTGKILFDLAEHFFLTGDTAWFKENQWRMQAAAEWIIRQKKLYMKDIPNRNDLEVAGLQPPQHISDIRFGHSQWYWYMNVEAWYCQGLKRFAEAMKEVAPYSAKKYLEESEQYRKDLKMAVDHAIALTPVMQVRNGTYRSYVPPIFYLRGPSIGQVVQYSMTDDDWSLEAINSIGIPNVNDPRVDGHLDVYEDVLSLNPVESQLNGGKRFQILAHRRRQHGLPAEEDWFWGGFSSQLGYSDVANIYLKRDEISSFLRQWVNNYASFVLPPLEYSFIENVGWQLEPWFLDLYKTGNWMSLACDACWPNMTTIRNSHSLAYFMEQFRSLLVWEDGNVLWLAKATPRYWLEQGKKISVTNAPTYFGTVSYEIVSDADHARINATVEMPLRKAPESVLLRFRNPKLLTMKSVIVNGKPWEDFDPVKEVVNLHNITGSVRVECFY
jgi:hypothetical protein